MCERVRAKNESCAGGRAFWFLAGAAAGMAIGLLYAPRSGRETRDAISGASRDWYGRSCELYERGRLFVDDAADLFERGRKLASGGIE